MPYLIYREAKSVNKMLQKSVLKIGDHSKSRDKKQKTINRYHKQNQAAQVAKKMKSKGPRSVPEWASDVLNRCVQLAREAQ